jgi:tripartite-type tricarboxylate transporter receptor subunit TctC
VSHSFITAAVAVAAASVLCAGTAGAQAPAAWPSRPITMVVPFAPGGIADITGRPLAQAMTRNLGQPIVIENRPGAGGGVGMVHVARQKPDGYTLLMALSSIVTIPEADRVNGRAPSYQMKEFTPVALVSADPTVLIVRADSPWKTVADLMKDARSRPGKITYSSSGIYGTLHVAVEMLAQSAGAQLLHVPFGGGGPAMSALLGGQVEVTDDARGRLRSRVLHLVGRVRTGRAAGRGAVAGAWLGEGGGRRCRVHQGDVRDGDTDHAPAGRRVRRFPAARFEAAGRSDPPHGQAGMNRLPSNPRR